MDKSPESIEALLKELNKLIKSLKEIFFQTKFYNNTITICYGDQYIVGNNIS